MRTLEEIVAEQQDSRASDDPVVVALMAELIRVAEELCVANDRLDTCLRIAGDTVDEAAIDSYEASAELTEERLHCFGRRHIRADPRIEILVSPVLIGADKKHLNAGLPAIHIQANHIRLSHAARVDAL